MNYEKSLDQKINWFTSRFFYLDDNELRVNTKSLFSSTNESIGYDKIIPVLYSKKSFHFMAFTSMVLSALASIVLLYAHLLPSDGQQNGLWIPSLIFLCLTGYSAFLFNIKTGSFIKLDLTDGKVLIFNHTFPSTQRVDDFIRVLFAQVKAINLQRHLSNTYKEELNYFCLNFLASECAINKQEYEQIYIRLKEIHEAKPITISSRDNSPTDRHKSHHVYYFGINSSNSSKPFFIGESIGGGFAEQGGCSHFDLEGLLGLKNDWKEHLDKSGCSWAIKHIEEGSTLQNINKTIANILYENVQRKKQSEVSFSAN